MSYAEQHPHPGERPPDPGPEPAAVRHDGRIAIAEMTAWLASRRALNEWVQAYRKHVVAQALDDLRPVQPKAPAEMIAFVVGVAFLEGSGTFAPGLLGLGHF